MQPDLSLYASTLGALPAGLLPAMAQTPVLMSLFDHHDMLLWANGAFRQTFGLGEHECISWSDMMRRNHERGIGTPVATHDIDAWLASARSRRGKVPFRAFEADLTDGRWIWMSETVTPEGCMLCIACDITHLRHDERCLRQERDQAMRAALTDALTGISNRAHIMSQLEHHLQQVRSGQSTCGVALMDLDHFKQVNDRYGHASGDVVLRHFAQSLPKLLRRNDCYGRIGGEEFLVVLPNACEASAPHAMTRLLQWVSQQHPLPEVPEFTYTCSVGLALMAPHENATALLHRVDQALYAAKAQGRNRWVWAQAACSGPP